MNSAVTRLLGIARKAGRVEAGEEPAGAAARSGHARVILVACDAADNSVRRAAHFAGGAKIPWLRTPLSKAELGGTVGRSSCALVAVTDIGFASSLAAKLALLDQARYGELSAALDTKAQKALQRQKEQRQHEKNLREGKRKPWAAPPKEQKAPPAPSKSPLRSSPVPSGRPKVPKGKLQVKGGLHRGPKPKA